MPEHDTTQTYTIQTFEDIVSHNGPIDSWRTGTFKTAFLLFVANPSLAKQKDGYTWQYFKSWFQEHLRQLRVKAHVLGLKTDALDALISVRYPPRWSEGFELFEGLCDFEWSMFDIEEAAKLKNKQTAASDNPVAARMGLDVKTDSEPSPDGPRPPNIIQWNRKLVTLEPIPWKLLEFLWENRSAPEGDAIDRIWGHDSHAAEGDGPLKSALRKVNRALMEVCCPYHASQKAGYITLG